MPDDATDGVAEHSSRLQPSIICMPQLHHLCSAAALVPNVYYPERMKALVSPVQ